MNGGFLLFLVLLLVVMYVLMIRPQRQRQHQQQAMLERAAVGDDILTSGGIYGTITQAEGDDLVVELAEGFTVHMTRRGIAAVLPPEDEDEPEEEDDEPAENDEGDEAAVMAREEVVTGAVEADASSSDRS